ncbi:Histidinol-phosphate aminotransferase 2, chloroplastic [Porphyridium purpureum]|uniref:histidinol-phosphate transaminase n=1 Tax=Porphyridium purpureum TaxID=35688 RepID=A0A5J4Z2T1_PORPP|nr:Histidinol-phosphate aminotransferase 2, chloroplastic [Porphyridium purpureum]|eukprot:POR4255..scf295_1
MSVPGFVAAATARARRGAIAGAGPSVSKAPSTSGVRRSRAWMSVSKDDVASETAPIAMSTSDYPDVLVGSGQREARQRKFSVKDAIRPELIDMDAYTPILPYEILAQRLGMEPKDIVKLDANENPFGPSPKVSDALRDAPFLHIYPDPESLFLREALEEYTGLPKEHLLVGAGADEIIDLLFRLFITPAQGESVVNFPPTFGMYKFDSDVNGATCINLMRDAEFRIPIDELEALYESGNPAKPPKMVFVTSPNNPDGSTITDSLLRRLLKLPSLIVLDEAYFEFCGETRIGWVREFDNLVVLRTFSKWAALAGMRVGYGAFPLEIIQHLWKIKQPYNVGVASQLAATVSVQDRADLLDKVEKMKAERTRFYEEVKRFDWLQPFPSSSNYVLCRVQGGRRAVDVKQQLAKRGILIRYYSSAGLAECIRVSMGTPEQMTRLYDALAEL